MEDLIRLISRIVTEGLNQTLIIPFLSILAPIESLPERVAYRVGADTLLAVWSMQLLGNLFVFGILYRLTLSFVFTVYNFIKFKIFMIDINHSKYYFSCFPDNSFCSCFLFKLTTMSNRIPFFIYFGYLGM